MFKREEEKLNCIFSTDIIKSQSSEHQLDTRNKIWLSDSLVKERVKCFKVGKMQFWKTDRKATKSSSFSGSLDTVCTLSFVPPTDSGGKKKNNFRASGKEPACLCRRLKKHRFNPWFGRFPGGGHGNPLQYSCLENPKDRGTRWATTHGVAKSRTQLKWLSMCIYIYTWTKNGNFPFIIFHSIE